MPTRTTIAFQLEKAGSEHGEGHGLLLFDLAAFDQLPESDRPAYCPVTGTRRRVDGGIRDVDDVCPRR
jgi:hypothetical protein